MIVVVYLLSDAADGLIHVRLFSSREAALDFILKLPQLCACWMPLVREHLHVRQEIRDAVRMLAEWHDAPTHTLQNEDVTRGIALDVEDRARDGREQELAYQVSFDPLLPRVEWRYA